MTESSYTAWDDKQYVWPPPDGWYQASDGKWWPEGYGPPESAAEDPTAGANGYAEASADTGFDQRSQGSDAEDTRSEFEPAGFDPDPGESPALANESTTIAAAAESAAVAGYGESAESAAVVDTYAESAESFADDIAGRVEAAESRETAEPFIADADATAGFEPAESAAADAAGWAETTESPTGIAESLTTDEAMWSEPAESLAADAAESGLDAATSFAPGSIAEAGAGFDPSDLVSEADVASSPTVDGIADSVDSRLADLAAETQSMESDGSGAFSSAPMEMNDLSSAAQSELFEGGFDDAPAGTGTDFAAAPDINDVMPTEEISSDSLPRSDAPHFDPVADLDPAGQQTGAADALGNHSLPAPDAADPFGADPAVADPYGADPTVADPTVADPFGADPAVSDSADAVPSATAPAGADLDFPAPDGQAGHGVPPDGAAAPDEGATQVLPADLPPAQTDFAPPPPGGLPDFAAPPAAQPLSPLDRPTGAPTSFPTGPPGPGGAQGPAPETGFAVPPTQDGPPEFAAPGQFAPPGSGPDQFGPPPGRQQFGGPLAPDADSILGSKSSGGRSKMLLLTIVGVLALVAIGAALFLAFGGGDSSAGNESDGTGPGSLSQPHPRSTGVVVFYPDGNVDQRWVVEVLEPVRDATAEIVGDGEVAGPEAGKVFAATRIRVRNESGADGASLGDLQFNAVNAAGDVIGRESDQCSFSVGDLDYGALVGIGTQVEGTVCWSIPATDLDGLKLGIESDKVSGRVHIALQ